MKKLILANFKSNKSELEVNSWFENFFSGFKDSFLVSLDVSVAPSFISLVLADDKISKSSTSISLSIQDISLFPAGSYTGAISGQNLKGLNIKYAIVGHSERRKYFRETSHDVALKVEQALRNDITPVICVDTKYLDQQLGLINDKDLSKCLVAYEPISAIGTGQNMNVGQVKQVINRIKKIAGDIGVLYGGSVDEQNINEYLLVSDGVLVGTSSLSATHFIKLIKKASI